MMAKKKPMWSGFRRATEKGFVHHVGQIGLVRAKEIVDEVSTIIDEHEDHGDADARFAAHALHVGLLRADEIMVDLTFGLSRAGRADDSS